MPQKRRQQQQQKKCGGCHTPHTVDVVIEIDNHINTI